jgi:SAM-dependent methyltransferase
MSTHTCIVCGTPSEVVFFELENFPVFCNVLYSSREEALQAKRADIRLVHCHHCGHIWNGDFDPKRVEYAPNYENSLHYSRRFQEYIRELTGRLIEDYSLRGKRIIEVGCGQGDFLLTLCEKAGNSGLGFDPSYRGEGAGVNSDVRFIRDFYSSKYVSEDADLICCRQVLEHFEQPGDFLKELRQVIGNRTDTVVFFEVPNVLWTLRDLGIWDIIYEHVSFFNPHSLKFLFEFCGFRVLNIGESFGGQFLCIEAQPLGSAPVAQNNTTELQQLEEMIRSFAHRYRARISEWTHQLSDMSNRQKTIVLWGAGSKGISFLNIMNDYIRCDYITDINPRKHHMFVAGSGQEIVDPGFLKEFDPDVVIIMNRLYQEEIEETLQEMEINSQFLFA